jgi:hypothetical protein
MILSARPDKSAAPTTASQRRDWNSHHSRPDNSFLNLSAVYALDGPPDSGLLAHAVAELVARHEALRTRFTRHGDELAQVIEPAGTAGSPRLRVASGPAAPAARDWLHGLVTEPFDLSSGMPFRAGLLLPSRSGDDCLLGIVIHHIVSDHLSIGVALNDLRELLAARAAQREPRLPDLPVQFPDYTAWWHEEARAGRFDRSFGYWAEQLSGAPETTLLPTSAAAAPAATEEKWRLPASGAALASASAALRTTPYVLLLAMFSSALADLTGAEDHVFACGSANRQAEALRHGIGRFTSGMALRLRTSRSTALADAVAQAHRVAMNAYVHSAVSLDAVLERELLGEVTSLTPFANIAFQLVDRAAESFAVPGLQVRPVDVAATAAKRDLHVTVERSPDELTLYIAYRPAALAPSWVDHLAASFAGRLDRLCRQYGAAGRDGAGNDVKCGGR